MINLEKDFNFDLFTKDIRNCRLLDRTFLISNYILTASQFTENLKGETTKEEAKKLFINKFKELFISSIYNTNGKIDILNIPYLFSNRYEGIVFGNTNKWYYYDEFHTAKGFKYSDIFRDSLYDENIFLEIFDLIDNNEKNTNNEKIINKIILLGWMTSESFKKVNICKKQAEIFDLLLSKFTKSHPEFEEIFGELNQNKIHSLYYIYSNNKSGSWKKIYGSGLGKFSYKDDDSIFSYQTYELINDSDLSIIKFDYKAIDFLIKIGIINHKNFHNTVYYIARKNKNKNIVLNLLKCFSLNKKDKKSIKEIISCLRLFINMSNHKDLFYLKDIYNEYLNWINDPKNRDKLNIKIIKTELLVLSLNTMEE